MSLLRARHWASTLAAVSCLVILACSKQGEGERCDRSVNEDEDCESGLVCKTKETLNQPTDRCCPPEGVAVRDDRCRTVSAPTASGGSSSGGATSSSGGATSSSGGAENGEGSGGTTVVEQTGGATSNGGAE